MRGDPHLHLRHVEDLPDHRIPGLSSRRIEAPAGVTMILVGRRHHRIGFKRSRRRCGREFAMPSPAPRSVPGCRP
jgi:hypothetical protein